jgi:anthranilate phosphoribosyltransferase
MSTAVQDAIRLLAASHGLSRDQTADAFGEIMRGETSPALIGAFLMALRVRGETADEVAGAAQALRAAMVPVTAPAEGVVVDTCGTGGGTVGTFNISTAAAMVAAAAGVHVAKHGNRSYTSRCGSADVLEALGVDITLDAARASAALAAYRFAFLFAPNFHPAMRHVGPVRKELGVPTIMNLLGPLANPAGVRRQVIGVADAARAPLVARALAQLGAEHAMIVYAEVGMDEVSPSGATRVWEVRPGQVTEWAIDPAAHRAEWRDLGDLAGGEPEQNAERIERLLAGGEDEAGARATVLNAGAALYVAGVVPGYAEGVAMAREVLAGGGGARVLREIRG